MEPQLVRCSLLARFSTPGFPFFFTLCKLFWPESFASVSEMCSTWRFGRCAGVAGVCKNVFSLLFELSGSLFSLIVTLRYVIAGILRRQLAKAAQPPGCWAVAMVSLLRFGSDLRERHEEKVWRAWGERRRPLKKMCESDAWEESVLARRVARATLPWHAVADLRSLDVLGAWAHGSPSSESFSLSVYSLLRSESSSSSVSPVSARASCTSRLGS